MKRLSLIFVILSLVSAGAVIADETDALGYVMRYADIGGGNIV